MEIKSKTSGEKYRLEVNNGVPRIAKGVEWYVEVEQAGTLYALTFDREPTDAEIADKIAQGQAREIITMEILQQRLAEARAENAVTMQALADLYEQLAVPAPTKLQSSLLKQSVVKE